jgi:hypothetical protein
VIPTNTTRTAAYVAVETIVSLLLELSPKEMAHENKSVPTEAVTRLLV